MKYLIKSSADTIRASITLPASKSISNRALILNALCGGACELRNLSDCDDTEVMLRALRSGGSDIDIKAAGTAMRFLTAYLAGTAGRWTITGTERMKNRPIGLLVDALNALGAHIEYIEKKGYPPLRIVGGALQGGEISLRGDVSSQYISALLMTAPLMKEGLTLHLTGNIISRPYICLTLQLMELFGVKAGGDGQTIRVLHGEYKPIRFTVESDWSAASYWYAIMALSAGAEIELCGLFKDSMQGDAAGAQLFARLGVGTVFTDGGVRLIHSGEAARELRYDFTDEPDLAQTFVVCCALRGIPFRFTGLQSLKIKETDRIEALKTELRRLGYVVKSDDGSMEWDGERCTPETNPVIATYEDHRMAMAFAPAAIVRREGLQIADPDVVTKSYPAFWDDLRKAGFGITEIVD